MLISRLLGGLIVLSAEVIYINHGFRYMAITVFSLKHHGGKQGYWKLGYIHVTLSSHCRPSSLITYYLKRERKKLGRRKGDFLTINKILQFIRRLIEQFTRALVDCFI